MNILIQHFKFLESVQNSNPLKQHQQIDEIALREDLNAWFLRQSERNLCTFVSVQTLVVAICGDFVHNQILSESEQRRQKAVTP